uniref:Uncharacterized protein n=1 Tax=Arundo donax TaxID=35708 RepID=A0A0A8Y3F7_ARUDO
MTSSGRGSKRRWRAAAAGTQASGSQKSL